MYHIPILLFWDQDIATPPRTLPESDKRSYKLCQFIDTSRYLSLPHRGGSRGRVQGRGDLRFSNTTGILPQKKTMWFIGVEVEQETSAPPPKKKSWIRHCLMWCFGNFFRLNLIANISMLFFKAPRYWRRQKMNPNIRKIDILCNVTNKKFARHFENRRCMKWRHTGSDLP